MRLDGWVVCYEIDYRRGYKEGRNVRIFVIVNNLIHFCCRVRFRIVPCFIGTFRTATPLAFLARILNRRAYLLVSGGARVELRSFEYCRGLFLPLLLLEYVVLYLVPALTLATVQTAFLDNTQGL